MKVRQGFVSNSSSTSYTVAFTPEKDNLNLKTFEFLLGEHGSRYSLSEKLETYKSTVADRKELLNTEIKTCQRDKAWLEEYVEKLIECAEIPAINLLMSELENSFHKQKGELADNIRFMRRDRNKDKWEDTIKDHIHNYKEAISRLNRDIADINGQLKLIEDLSDDTVIARWKQDAGSSLLTNLLDMLIKDKRVIILERYTD